MRDFDPLRIASEWHSGQGSALYAYMSTDRIPTEDFKDRLVSEIERAMAHADDDGLDELEYLLMHVEDSHPDLYPNDEMHEEVVYESETEPSDVDGKDQWYDATSEKENPAMKEGDSKCEACGGMKTEGTCECSMAESAKMTLSDAIRQIVSEMKLSVAGRAPFHFGAGSEVDEDDVGHFLLSKKKKEIPEPAKSGVKEKSSGVPKVKPKRKSKKAR